MTPLNFYKEKQEWVKRFFLCVIHSKVTHSCADSYVSSDRKVRFKVFNTPIHSEFGSNYFDNVRDRTTRFFMSWCRRCFKVRLIVMYNENSRI